MIEVEKKFQLTKEQEARLLDGATFYKQVTNTDVFYDTPDFHYTKDDTWLRTRNDKYELKIRIHEIGKGNKGTIYDEITDEQRIREILKLENNISMAEAIEHAELQPFARIKKERRSYKLKDFRIDIDIYDFGYELAEIELLVEKPSEAREAEKRIVALAQAIGLDQTPQRGKVIEYLYRFDRKHYEALLEAGVADK